MNKCRSLTNVSPSTIHETPISKTTLLEIDKDTKVASQAILKYVSGTWWSWDAGSGFTIIVQFLAIGGGSDPSLDLSIHEREWKPIVIHWRLMPTFYVKEEETSTEMPTFLPTSRNRRRRGCDRPAVEAKG